jgi:glutamine synthetase
VVFDVQDALAAADSMVLFRNATKQALRRAGYHATFMCRPQFPNIVSSGWHLHQSLIDAKTGQNNFMPAARVPGIDDAHEKSDAARYLSMLGQRYLAGLLAHAQAITPFAVPTINGYARYQPNMMAPQRAIWGHGSRGAALRVIGGAGDAATRIENRMGEPSANPYLYIASQIFAGLDGIARDLMPPHANALPYVAAPLSSAPHSRPSLADGDALPTSLAAALDALHADATMREQCGAAFIDYFAHIKRFELARYDAAQKDWEQREYFWLF